MLLKVLLLISNTFFDGLADCKRRETILLLFSGSRLHLLPSFLSRIFALLLNVLDKLSSLFLINWLEIAFILHNDYFVFTFLALNDGWDSVWLLGFWFHGLELYGDEAIVTVLETLREILFTHEASRLHGLFLLFFNLGFLSFHFLDE